MNTDEIVKTDNFHAPVLKNKKGDYRMKPGQTVYLGFSTDFLIREADPWRGECWEMIRERRDLNFIFLTKSFLMGKSIPVARRTGWLHLKCK